MHTYANAIPKPTKENTGAGIRYKPHPPRCLPWKPKSQKSEGIEQTATQNRQKKERRKKKTTAMKKEKGASKAQTKDNDERNDPFITS